LTRGSIDVRKKLFAKQMDARVKPGHDELRNNRRFDSGRLLC